MKRFVAMALVLILLLSSASADNLQHRKTVFESVFNGFAEKFMLPKLSNGVISGDNIIYKTDYCAIAVTPKGEDAYEAAVIIFYEKNVPDLYAWINCLYLGTGNKMPREWMHVLYYSYITSGKGQCFEGAYYFQLTTDENGCPNFAMMEI